MPGKIILTLCAMMYFATTASITQAAGRKTRFSVEVAQFHPEQAEQKSEAVRSKVELSEHGYAKKIKVADLSIPDAISGCPVDTMPVELNTVVTELTNKVESLVSSMKNHQGDRCSALSDRLQVSQNLVGNAYQYQFLAKGNETSSSNQDAINLNTQQAKAVNQLLMTTSDILQNCVSKDTLNDQQVIQKLVAQIVTLTGLFMGGWEGIAIATGGQIIGSIPLFTGDIEHALKQFNHYNEMNERGSFLCYLRQIRKTSCLLFADKSDQFINGLDLSFQSGPAKTTLDSIEQFKKDDAKAVADLELLRRIKIKSDAYMVAFTQVETQSTRTALPTLSTAFKNSLDELDHLCHAVQPLEPLSDPRVAEPSIQEEIEKTQRICNHDRHLGSLSFTQLSDLYWQLYSISSYYQSLIQSESTTIGKIGRTIESLHYFIDLKKSLTQYSDSNAGNQTRIHFLDLSRKLSKTLGVTTFKRLFRPDFEKFTHHQFCRGSAYCATLPSEPKEHSDVRSRAFRAMIDLCMTLDPTLACLDVGNPKDDSLFKVWTEHCVGAASHLCSEPLTTKERDTFLPDPMYRSYFDSLCGPPKKTPPSRSPGIIQPTTTTDLIHAQ